MTVSNVITYKNKLYTKKNKFSKNLENTEKNCVKGSGVRSLPALYTPVAASAASAAGMRPAPHQCAVMYRRSPAGLDRRRPLSSIWCLLMSRSAPARSARYTRPLYHCDNIAHPAALSTIIHTTRRISTARRYTGAAKVAKN